VSELEKKVWSKVIQHQTFLPAAYS